MPSTHTRLSQALWPLFLAALLAGAGCSSLSSSEGGGAAGDGEKDKDEEEAEEQLGLAKKLELAKLELELARLGSEQELASAEQELAAVRVEAEKARLEREGFHALGRARGLDQARLDLDRSRGRAEDAAAELAELESMYASEEFATKTKELVLTRSRRELEHARRALVLAESKLKETEGFELVGKERELEKENISAGKGLLEAEQALSKLRLEQKIAIAKAEQEIEELMRKIEKAEAKKGKKEKEKGKEKDKKGEKKEGQP